MATWITRAANSIRWFFASEKLDQGEALPDAGGYRFSLGWVLGSEPLESLEPIPASTSVETTETLEEIAPRTADDASFSFSPFWIFQSESLEELEPRPRGKGLPATWILQSESLTPEAD